MKSVERKSAPDSEPGLSESLAALRSASDTPPPIPNGIVPPPLPEQEERDIDIWKKKRDERVKAQHMELPEDARRDFITDAAGHLKTHGVSADIIQEFEERLSKFKTRHELQAENAAMLSDLRAAAAQEREERESAREMARRIAPDIARPQAPQPNMIGWLDAWTNGDKARTGREQFEERLAKHFPKESSESIRVEMSGHADGVAQSLFELPEEMGREVRREGLEKSHGRVSQWLRSGKDAFDRVWIGKAMLSLVFGYYAASKPGGPLSKLRLTAFAVAMTGAGRELLDIEPLQSTGLSMPDTSVVPMPTPSPEAVPVQLGTEGPPPHVLLNPQPNTDHVGEAVPSQAPQSEEAHPVAHVVDNSAAPKPYEIKDNRSVWSGLMDRLGEKGIDLSKAGKGGLAEVFHRAVEDTNTESVFMKLGETNITNVDWNNVPDKTKVLFDKIFANEEFLRRFKELITSPEYKTLGAEVKAMGGVDAFIKQLQSVFQTRV